MPFFKEIVHRSVWNRWKMAFRDVDNVFSQQPNVVILPKFLHPTFARYTSGVFVRSGSSVHYRRYEYGKSVVLQNARYLKQGLVDIRDMLKYVWKDDNMKIILQIVNDLEAWPRGKQKWAWTVSQLLTDGNGMFSAFITIPSWRRAIVGEMSART